MALYRTYRPARLDEVVGQEHVMGPLTRALEHDRVHHAYLFSGPRGCGKTSTARILARSLNCEQGPTPDPCGVCQSCMDLAANGPGSLDVIELDAASHGGVDDTRELRERAMFAPASSRYKIYIIDEAHMVTPQGFNALLKLVEEPPEHVRFIFATTEAEKVLPTIRSRTHNYTFRLVPLKILQQHLAEICEKEGVPAEPEALTLIARAGAGSVRDSLSVLGQVMSGCGPEGITYAEAVAQLGMTDATLLDETVNALADHDGAALFRVIESVMDAGHEPRRFVTDLLERMRDLIVLRVVPTAAESGLVEGSPDAISRMAAQAERFGQTELTRYAEVVSAALSSLKGATAPRLQLELMVAQLMLPSLDDDASGIAARLDQLERRMHATPPAAPGAASPADTTPVEAPKKREPAPPVASKPTPPPKLSDIAPSSDEPVSEQPRLATDASIDIIQIRSLWPAVLEVVKANRKVAWLVLNESAPLSWESGTLAVGVREASKLANARSNAFDGNLRAAVAEVLRIDANIDLVLAPDAPSPDVAGAPEQASDEPSIDDEALDDLSGVDLAIRELGATTIGEIEHS